LRKAEAEYFELVQKNIEIEMACDRLELAVLAAKGQAGEGQQTA
jgi:hypothetical protein